MGAAGGPSRHQRLCAAYAPGLFSRPRGGTLFHGQKRKFPTLRGLRHDMRRIYIYIYIYERFRKSFTPGVLKINACGAAYGNLMGPYGNSGAKLLANFALRSLISFGLLKSTLLICLHKVWVCFLMCSYVRLGHSHVASGTLYTL